MEFFLNCHSLDILSVAHCCPVNLYYKQTVRPNVHDENEVGYQIKQEDLSLALILPVRQRQYNQPNALRRFFLFLRPSREHRPQCRNGELTRARAFLKLVQRLVKRLECGVYPEFRPAPPL